jgi:predicted Zn-dependent peptidase
LWEAINAAAFVAHPYGYPVIGWEGDIQNLKATEAREFYRAHYTPDRAVGVIVGDVDTTRTVELIREHFGKLPARAEGQYRPRIVQEPAQNGERRVKLNLTATPTILMGWHKPVAPDPADIRAAVLMEALTGGRSAVWFTEFIKDRRIASDISAFTGPGDHEPNLFFVYATPQAGATLGELETAIREAVARLHTEPIPRAEIERARKVIRANTVRTLETNLGLAQTLGEMTLMSGDPYYLERRLRELETVTAEDLREFAARYLTPGNLTVGVIDPPVVNVTPDS